VRSWGWVLAYIVAVWLDLTASSLFPAGSPAPNVFLIVTIAAGLLRGPLAGVATGVTLGLTADLISGRLVGLGALTVAIVGAVAGLIARRVFRENLLIVAAVALLLSGLWSLLYACGAWLYGTPFHPGRAFMAIGLPIGIYNSILVPALYSAGFRRFGQIESTAVVSVRPRPGGAEWDG
jgi:rod shape-determining protein MreD